MSRRADASWRLGLNQCIMLGSRMAGDLTEKRLRDRTRPLSAQDGALFVECRCTLLYVLRVEYGAQAKARRPSVVACRLGKTIQTTNVRLGVAD